MGIMAVGCTRKGISSQKRAVGHNDVVTRYLHMLTHLSDPYISVDLGAEVTGACRLECLEL